MQEGNGYGALTMLKKDIDCHLEEAEAMPMEFNDCPSDEGKSYHRWSKGAMVLLLRKEQVQVERDIKLYEAARKTTPGTEPSPKDDTCSEVKIGPFTWKVRGKSATELLVNSTWRLVALILLTYIAFSVRGISLSEFTKMAPVQYGGYTNTVAQNE